MHDDLRDYSDGKRFRFAVVDLDKARKYPLNFVCLLPTRLDPGQAKGSKFSEVFGDQSADVAKKLLAEALKREDDVDVKSEIERRLRIFEPDRFMEKKCVSCGRVFQADSKKRFKQKLCEDCIKRKIGSSVTGSVLPRKK
jgi:hypothetical protein